MEHTFCKLTLYRGTIRSERYNSFFNPNICHICKRADAKYETCKKCYSITYCGMSHKQIHEVQHMHICLIIRIFLSKDATWNFRRLSLEEWIQSRKEFLRSIKSELLNDLEPYEEQMITLAKSCLICHQQGNLRTCTTCLSANYCTDHEDAFIDHHRSRCEELKDCLKLDRLQFNHTLKFYNFFHFNDRELASAADMVSYIIQCAKRLTRSETYSWQLNDYFYSDYVSGPLTLYHGLAHLNLLPLLHIQTPICVVHIIAGNYIDKKYVSAWEILLHLLRTIKDLKIIFIGTELDNETDNIDICSICMDVYKQKLSYHCYRMSYNDYVDSTYFKQPNVMIGFQVDFSDKNHLYNSFSKLRVIISPLLITAKSKHISEQNINNLAEIAGYKLKYHDENKFNSRRPYRDFEDVFYRNKYLAIF